MPTWSTEFGGPLRHDQVEAVTAYVMHWGEFAPDPSEPTPTPTPLDCETPEECGELLFQNKGCIGCHVIQGEGGAVGPNLTNVYSEKGEDYVRQSILNPNAVIAEGFQANVMPQNFSQLLSEEELSFIVSYLASVGE
jgi:mono/diheme cytochrome c family protein